MAGLYDGLQEASATIGAKPPPPPKGLYDGLAPATPDAARGAIESIQAGFQGSAPGLAWRGRLPELVINPEHATWWERALAGGTQVVSELPLMVAGAIMGTPAGAAIGTGLGGPGLGTAVGGVMGAGLGMGAVPAAIRETYMQALKAGEVTTAADFWNALREVAKTTAKEAGLNAVTMGAGAMAGRALGAAIAPKIGTAMTVGTARGAIETADIATQIALMPTIPAAFQGRLPDAQEFLDAAILIGGMKGAHVTAQKITSVFLKTGRTPAEQVQDINTGKVRADEFVGPPAPPPDPALLRDMLSKRLTELNTKYEGTPDKTVEGPDGKPMVIAGTPKQFMSKEEQAERAWLAANIDNPDALAKAYTIRSSQNSGKEIPDRAENQPLRLEMLRIQENLFRETDRLNELEGKTKGTPGSVVVDDFGVEQTIPGRPPAGLTAAESAEVLQLRARVAQLEGRAAAINAESATPPALRPTFTDDQFAEASRRAERRLAELETKQAEGALTDRERAERVFLANNKTNPEGLARHFELEPLKPARMTRAQIDDSAQRVHDDVLAQLKDADAAREASGLAPLGTDHADAVAALVRARVRTRAERLGVLPEDIYNERPVQIVDETAPEVAAAEAAIPADAPRFTPPEVDLFGNPVAVTNAPRFAVENKATIEIPLADLILSKEVAQFKKDANAAGVIVPLGGTFDRTGVGPIQVWERLDGTLEVISGRHRLDLAKRSNETTIPAQIHREADGFTAREAAVLDAQLNIREEQGSVADYVQYFKDSGKTREAAELDGLLARAKGKSAFAIARDGSNDLISAHRAGQLSDEAALSISGTAPGSERLQALGIAMVNEGKSILIAVNTMRAVDLMAAERMAAGTQGDIFGFDDSAMKEAAAMAKKASAKQRAIGEQIAAVNGASKRPELARKMGVNVDDPAAVQLKIIELRQEQYLWDNWPLYPELVAKLRGETLKQDEFPPMPPETPAEAAARDQEAAAQAQRNTERKAKELDGLTRYWRARTWATEAEARENIRRRIVEDNERYPMFAAMDPSIVDQMRFTRAKGGKVKLVTKRDPRMQVSWSEERPTEGDTPDVDWTRTDQQDKGTPASIKEAFGRDRGNLYQAWIPINELPKPRGEDIKDGVLDQDSGARAELSHRGEPPPLKVRISPGGKVQLMDGNHRLAYWNERGMDSVPAWVIDERPMKHQPDNILYQDETRATWYKSALGEVVEKANMKSAPAKGWLDLLKGQVAKGGVKADEIKWSGVEEWLQLQEGKVTKEQVADYLKNSGVKVEEKMLGGDTIAPLPTDPPVRRAVAYLEENGFEISEDPGNPGRWGVMDIEGGEIYFDRSDVLSAGDALDPGMRPSVEQVVHYLNNPPSRNSAKFATYQLPGGENYRELLLTLPTPPRTQKLYHEVREELIPALEAVGLPRHAEDAIRRRTLFERDNRHTEWAADADAPIAQEAINKLIDGGHGDVLKLFRDTITNPDKPKQREHFRSSHFDQEDILAHIRFNERTDADGKRVLFIEEFQSDWAQQGKKKGFAAAPDREAQAAADAQRGALDDAVAKESTTWNAARAIIKPYLGGIDAERPNAADTAINKIADMESIHGRNTEWRIEYGINDPAHIAVIEAALRDSEVVGREERKLLELEAKAKGKSGIPQAPFVGKTDAWVALSLKRMIRYAAENGFDKIAWTRGEQQVERYTSALRKAVDVIEWKKTPEGVQLVGYKGRKPPEPRFRIVNADGLSAGDWTAQAASSFYRSAADARQDYADITGRRPEDDGLTVQESAPKVTQGTKVVDTTEKEDALSDSIGKAMADRIINDPNQTGTIEGENITVSDTGMAGFYDRIVPAVAKDVLKKLGGGKAGEVNIGGTDIVRLKFTDGPYRGEVYSDDTTGHPITFKTREEAEQYAKDHDMPRMEVVTTEPGAVPHFRPFADAEDEIFGGASTFDNGDKPLITETVLIVDGKPQDVTIVIGKNEDGATDMTVMDAEGDINMRARMLSQARSAKAATDHLEDLWDMPQFWKAFGADSGIDVTIKNPPPKMAQPGFDVTPTMREKAMEGLPLFQQHRGSYDIAENLVTTMQGADKSTVVHELGHSWLEEMKADAARADAPEQIKRDWETLRRELAIGENGDISRPSHEQFARSVERYLADGEAPSKELRGVFERFKEWLLAIYKDLRNLNVEINPELKGVLDRMLATDEEIAAARELNVPRAYVPEAMAVRAETIVPPPEPRRKIEPGFKAEQAAMEPYADELPAGPGEAPDTSRINYAYINTPMDVKLALERLSEIDQANIQAQRGGTDGVKSWAESNAEQAKYLNDILGGGPDTLKLLQPRDPDQAGPDVRLGILKKMAVGAAKDSARLRDVVLAAGHDATTRQQLEYLGSIERARMIQAEFLGERASVARALNALKDVTDGTGEISRMLEVIGLGTDNRMFQDRTPAEEQAYMKAKLDEILQNYKGKSVLDIAKLHKEIGTLKGTFKFTDAVTKASKWEMIVEGWKAGLLSGPVTHITNLFGTGPFQVVRAPVDFLAAMIGMARGASPGMGESDRASMSEGVARLTGWIGGAADGLKVGYATFKLDDPTGKTESYRTAIPGRAGEIIRIPLRLMGAEDAILNTMYTRGEYRTLAIRQAFDDNMNPNTREFAERVQQYIDNPTEAMQAAAETAAARMTFNSPLGEKGVALQLFVAKWNLQWMIPFIRTPINIFKEMARMSPFAPAISEWRAAIAKGGVERDRALAELALGTTIMGLTMAYAFSGNVSGGGSADPGKNRGKAGVWQPYSILIGDTWYEYARIQPMGTLIGMAADIANVWDHMDDEQKDKVPKLLAVAFSNAVTNQTFLQGITNAVNALSDPVRFGPRFIQQLGASTVPNIIGQPTAMADPYVREVNSVLDAVQSRIPGLRQDLLPKRDWLGEPIPTKDRVLGIGPSRTQEVSKDKVRLEAARLDLSMAASPKKTHIGKGTGKLGDVELTPEERDTFEKVSGEFAHKILDNIVNAQGYDAIPDMIKRRIFQKVLTASHRIGAIQAMPMEKRLAYIQSISEKVVAELEPGETQQ